MFGHCRVAIGMLFCMTGCSRNGTNSIVIELFEIQAGKFNMGSPAGVAVTLTKPFGLGKTVVN